MNNPHLRKLFNKMLDERIESARVEGESSGSRLLTVMTPKPADKSSSKKKNTTTTDEGNGRSNLLRNKLIKSPSDTTIYAPALQRNGPPIPAPHLVNTAIMNDRQRRCSNEFAMHDAEGIRNGFENAVQVENIRLTPDFNSNSAFGDSGDSNNVINKISNFVDQMRIQQEQEDSQLSPAQINGGGPVRSAVTAPGYEEAQRRSDQVIIQTEKYRAEIEKPPGRNQTHNFGQEMRNIENGKVFGNMLENHGTILDRNERTPEQFQTRPRIVGVGISDDDFFHLTCHIDSNLKAKIEKGQFVDLDKLLPKERSSFDPSQNIANETKLEWVQSEGSTYLVPAKRISRINCFRRWEQAFQMYATIYCTENPQRAREIWQYVSVINTASMSYSWDNVYSYDITFRQLMEFNPERSWAVTYNQMWNLSMTNPIVPGNGNGRRFSTGGGSASFGGSSNQSLSKRKLDYCWSFNKGAKCKFGRKCKFIERCSYCDSPNHGVVSCDKLRDKEIGGASKNSAKKFKKH